MRLSFFFGFMCICVSDSPLITAMVTSIAKFVYIGLKVAHNFMIPWNISSWEMLLDLSSDKSNNKLQTIEKWFRLSLTLVVAFNGQINSNYISQVCLLVGFQLTNQFGEKVLKVFYEALYIFSDGAFLSMCSARIKMKEIRLVFHNRCRELLINNWEHD